MPTRGLSLVGFMDQLGALNHLKIACVPPPATDDAALIAEWQAATAALGPAIANAGYPQILDLPPAHTTYIQQLMAIPWVAALSHPGLPLHGASYKLVEIAPLLAFQFVVDLERSEQHCGGLAAPPDLNALLPVCLPIAKPNGEYHSDIQDRSLIIKSRSLNLRLNAGGFGIEDPNDPNRIAGISFGWSPNLVHVVRFNGRCYLHNGFHRVVGAGLAGATHIPCVFRDVPDQKTAQILGAGITFDLPILESANPPTVAHFIQNRAHTVSLRKTTRILHLSWAEYGIYDE